MSKQRTIEDVRRFWNENPLWSGECAHEVGSREWFEDLEKVVISDGFAGEEPDVVLPEGLSRQSKILDVGCGPGNWVRYFLRNGYTNISACDLTIKAVELTKKSLDLFGLPADPVIAVGNAESLPYKAETFDHVNCQGVIHHTPYTTQCIREFHRVLKPGGTVCFSVYYRVLLLRHPRILRLLCGLLAISVSVKGRGRESIFASGDPLEIVRSYDGNDNPIGKAYTLKEVSDMLLGLFTMEHVARTYFPVRWIPVKIPNRMHRWLHNKHGLMVLLHCRKTS